MVGWRRLTGGITSSVHRLTVEQNGRRGPYVLRRWVPDGEHAEYVIGAVASETAVLTALERSDVPAPRVIGSTTDAAHAGPAVLMTRVPGHVHLMPGDRERWLQQMAHTLTRIHALDIDAKPFESWLDRSRLSPLPDASRPDIWSEAIRLVAEERPLTHTCFIHRDYQHFNLLWSRERLTGVIDWVEASGNYVKIHTKSDAHLLRESMKNMEAKLDPKTFVRIHRSAIVNIDHIKELEPWFHGEYIVIMRDGTRLTASRVFSDRLSALIA